MSKKNTEKIHIRGEGLLRVLRWSMVLLPVLFVVSAMGDWNTLGIVAFGLFLVVCTAYPIIVGIVVRSTQKLVTEAAASIMDAKRTYVNSIEEERRSNPPVINDLSIQEVYQRLLSELEKRVAETSFNSYFTDPYCVIRHSILLLIGEVVKERADADISTLLAKIETDELYQRRDSDWTELKDEYEMVLEYLRQVANPLIPVEE